jgi:type II secretory pathway pseudopilin PulG
MYFYNKKRNKGFSLVETIVYASLLALLVTVITYVITLLFRANSIVKSTRDVENSAIAATDRMIREIRAASSVDLPNSSFGVDDGILSLIIPSGSGTRTVRFYTENSKIMVDDDGVQTGPLTLSSTQVTSLRFYYLTSTTSQAVKFETVLIGPISDPGISEKLYGTAVLRGSYIQ